MKNTVIQIIQDKKVIEEHSITESKLVNELLKKIQFSSMSLAVIKYDKYSITVRWAFISGYELKMKIKDKIYADSVLFPSRVKVYLILNGFISNNNKILKKGRWVNTSDFSIKSLVNKSIIIAQLVFSISSLILFMVMLFGEKSDLIVPGLFLISHGLFWGFINFKGHFYHRDSLENFGNTANSLANKIYLAVGSIVLGISFLVAGLLET